MTGPRYVVEGPRQGDETHEEYVQRIIRSAHRITDEKVKRLAALLHGGQRPAGGGDHG